jgi:hypothetical protein
MNFKEEITKRNELKLTYSPLDKFIKDFINYSEDIHTIKTVKAYTQSHNFLKSYFGDVLIDTISCGEMTNILRTI